ncbi:MAG TPA: TMEM165/GDT1 family protein [Rhizomicrobium sp.]|jgi:putative Ca2+/H+ antiporter (TMEM165/GDT1 family)
MRELLTMFVTIFLAELGDKTQIATMLFASERKAPPLAVFAASAGALVLGAAISVAVGQFAGRHIAAGPLKLVAGLGFVAIGGYTIFEYFRS